MISRDEALSKVRARVAQSGFDVDEQRITERARGWVFVIRKPGSPMPLVGGPLFVDKESGEIIVLPSANTARWLDEYDATGTPPQTHAEWHYLGAAPKKPIKPPIGGLRKKR